MFTSYGTANYKPSALLLVWYEQEIAATLDTSLSAKYVIKLTRRATKKFSFLDMTAACAATCASGMSTKYTRSFAAWEYSVSGDSGAQTATITQTTVTERKTDIANTVTNCGSRDVSISVNESDVKYVVSSSTTVADPSSYFTDEDARDYDETWRAKTTEGLSLYSSNNASIAQELDVKYSVSKLASSRWQFTRYATKSYTFIGMSQATAENCAAAKLSQYTRECRAVDTSQSGVYNMNRSVIKLCAGISSSYNGHTWSVAVSVNETDVRITSSNSDPATVFATENQRNYDGSSNLVLNSVTRNNPRTSASVNYTETITDFNFANLVFQYRTDGSATWNDSTISGGNVSLPDEPVTCRLVYKSLESNTVSCP